MSDVIKNLSHDQGEIIRNILRLHVPEGKIDCDPTFSTGGFYRGTGIETPTLRFDINPQAEGVVKADARCLPLENESISCMMFDPPFLATTGKSLREEKGNIINRRFSVFSSEDELFQFYRAALAEANRVLKQDGILIFKCQDKVSSGKQYFSHVFVMNEAVKAGFYPLDLFYLMAWSRLMAHWQMRSQKHARKFVSVFWVFKKCNKRIEYIRGE